MNYIYSFVQNYGRYTLIIFVGFHQQQFVFSTPFHEVHQKNRTTALLNWY